MSDIEFSKDNFETSQEIQNFLDENEEDLTSHQKDKIKKAKREKEEEEKQHKQKRKKQGLYSVAGILLLAVLTAIGPQLLSQVSGGASTQANISVEGQPVIGNENASVTVVEFGDYSCGYCRQFEMNTYPRLKENYIDTGDVKFSYINLAFLGRDSQKAAEASECVYNQADNEDFWSFHKAVYENQGQEDGWVSEDLLMSLARDNTNDLDYGELQSCISSGETSGQVRDERATANTNGIDSTPTLLVNGETVDGNDYRSISNAIDRELR